MIIIYYPGLLEEEKFRYERNYIHLTDDVFNTVKGPGTDELSKPKDWFIPFCNIAESLSKQGYVVFVQYDLDVMTHLHESTEKISSLVPSLNLRDSLIGKIKRDIRNTNDEKDRKRYEINLKNIETEYNFEKDIDRMLNDEYINTICIKSLIQDLDLMISVPLGQNYEVEKLKEYFMKRPVKGKVGE